MNRLGSLALVTILLAACNKGPEAGVKPKNPPPEAKVPQADLPPPLPGRTHECPDAKRIPHQCAVTAAVAPAEAKVGEAVVARLTVKPKPGYKMNKDFPIAVSVQAPAGVEVVKIEQDNADVAKLDEKELVMEVKFTPKDAGEKKFTAAFNFAVCTETECAPLVDNLAWNVHVK